MRVIFIFLNSIFKESKITHFEKPVLCAPDGLQSCLCGADLGISWSPGTLIALFIKNIGILKTHYFPPQFEYLLALIY